MTESLQKSLADIRKLTPDLNKVTDEAAQVVAMVEKVLADAGVSTSPEVDAGRVVDRDLKLSYQRSNGRLRLMVAAWVGYTDDFLEDHYEQAWEKPWSECSRTEKLCSFKALPNLLQQIAEEEKQALEETSGIADTIRAVMAAVKS